MLFPRQFQHYLLSTDFKWRFPSIHYSRFDLYRLKDTYFLIYFYETIFYENFFFVRKIVSMNLYSAKIYILWNERYYETST